MDSCPHCGRLINSRGWSRHEQKCAMNPAIRQRLLTIIDDGYGRLRKARDYDRMRRASHPDLPCSHALISAFGDSWDSVAACPGRPALPRWRPTGCPWPLHLPGSGWRHDMRMAGADREDGKVAVCWRPAPEVQP